ncbi:MAG: serine--tRNA ligase [Candidatus Aenigmatarchaeota archaeon]
MLDINLIRKNPEIVRRDLEKRNDKEKIKLLEEVIELDKKWREELNELNKLRKKRNELSVEIAKMKKEGKDVSELLKEAEKLPEEIKILEKAVEEKERRIREILMVLPNILHESVPIGKDENDNVVVKTWGKIPEFKFKPKDHQDLAIPLDLIDIERAAKVAGSRFYYLKNALVELNWALIKYGLDFIKNKGFKLFQPPYMLRREALEGAIAFQDFEDMIYKIEGENLYLIGTAEHALLAYHMNEILDGKDLPLLYAGISPCFRKEAGTHGKDTKGIFRVHQFEKVEQFVFCKPEESWDWHEKLLKNAEEFFQSLGIPYRVVNICSGDIGSVAAKKYDIEAWLPGQGKYREVVSCSNCTDYQARRANIRFREGNEIKFVHTLNSTLVATERAIIAIMENYQQEDGSILIPKVLQPYLNAEKITKDGLK